MDISELSPEQMKMVLAFVKAKEFTDKMKKFEDRQNKFKKSVKKYHMSEKGKMARREASRRYYLKKKAKKKPIANL
tara:strand:+ start:1190 stop:1417 length:228 start_codon:yes stop_codon:yes gene_type:complete